MTITRSTTDITTALEKHVQRFVDNNGDFSPTTVTNGLNNIHSAATGVKGFMISSFNATHASVCPVMHGHFGKDEYTGYARHMHLGTTRIWNTDGSINEANWEKFIAFCAIQYGNDLIVLKSRLVEYLAKCYQEDLPEQFSGRNNNSMFSSKPVQGTAATAAWDEVYDRLTCGWIIGASKANALEPYITATVLREFFEDSTKAFLRAENKSLPVAKPTFR